MASCFSASNCHTIALCRTEEGREGIEKMLVPLMRQLVQIKNNGIKIDNQKIDIDLSIAADWKFLALVMGLNAANSRWFCLFCLCQNDQRSWTTVDWNSTQYQRTLKNLQGGKCTDESCRKGRGNSHPHGVIAECLLLEGLFDMDDILIDVLHQFLRMMDLLLKGLIDIVTEYRIEYKLTQECLRVGVVFKKLDSKNAKTGKPEWTSLDGSAKKILLERLNLDNILPTKEQGFQKHDDWILLWLTYQSINSYLQSTEPPKDGVISSVEDYEMFALELLLLVRLVLGEDHVTPYLHVLVFHVPRMLRKHGNIAKFSCSAQELKNSLQTQTFFRRTTPSKAAKQIINHEHRTLWYRSNPEAFGTGKGTKRMAKRLPNVMEEYKKRQRKA